MRPACLRRGTNMSCNGCRVLRKGCSETCILRPCLQWIPTPDAQGHATVFVAKFFGRAGLISFLSAVPESQRPSLFQSLLLEACGRTVNPVSGAVGLLWTGNWNVCQTAVETVLGGGTLRTIPDLVYGGSPAPPSDEDSEAEVACTDMWKLQDWKPNSRFSNSRSRPLIKRKRTDEVAKLPLTDLDLRLTSGIPAKMSCELQRPETPSRNSEESVTTSCIDLDLCDRKGDVGNEKLLNLFI